MKPRKSPALKRVNIYVTRAQWHALSEVARLTGLTASEHLRRALDAYLDATGDDRTEQR